MPLLYTASIAFKQLRFPQAGWLEGQYRCLYGKRCQIGINFFQTPAKGYMQFAVVALDATDEGALARRMAARQGHLALSNAMQEPKHLLYACALLDDAKRMIGSIMIVDFPNARRSRFLFACERAKVIRDRMYFVN
jgi:uncharacterized protein YciI